MMLERSTSATLEEVKWEDVKKKVHAVNPQLAEKINSLKLGNNFVLYKARYPFGCTILNRSTFYLPYNGKLVSLHDAVIPKKIKENLMYNNYILGSVPLGLCLENTAELYMQQEDRIIPFSFFTPGKIFGLWSSLNNTRTDPAPRVWYITAGARSIFLLPKITDTPSYKKLSKARGLKQPMPRDLLQHGYVLAEMTKHVEFSNPWYTEMLFFPNDWLEQHEGEAWARFHLYLYEIAWEKADYWRNKVVYDYIWDSFIRDFGRRNLKVSPYIVDIVEHIVMIGLGVLPGFRPAIDDNEGPITDFQNDFIKIYGLRYFAPTIMVPAHFDGKPGEYIYWSLHLASYFESFPKPRTPSSIISDLREIINLLQKFSDAVLEGKIPEVIGTPFYDFFKKIQFDFFHSDVEIGDAIRHSREMAKEDKRLITCSKAFGKREFSEISPFVRGCVRISAR